MMIVPNCQTAFWTPRTMFHFVRDTKSWSGHQDQQKHEPSVIITRRLQKQWVRSNGFCVEWSHSGTGITKSMMRVWPIPWWAGIVIKTHREGTTAPVMMNRRRQNTIIFKVRDLDGWDVGPSPKPCPVPWSSNIYAPFMEFDSEWILKLISQGSCVRLWMN